MQVVCLACYTRVIQPNMIHLGLGLLWDRRFCKSLSVAFAQNKREQLLRTRA